MVATQDGHSRFRHPRRSSSPQRLNIAPTCQPYPIGRSHKVIHLMIVQIRETSSILRCATDAFIMHANMRLFVHLELILFDYEAGTAPIASTDREDSPAGFSVSATPSSDSFVASPRIPPTTLSPAASCAN